VRKGSVEAIVRALNASDVRYLIAGGLAVVAHGFVRLTADVDLVLDLERDNLLRAAAVFAALGYRPTVPVTLEAFADAQERGRWVRDEGMTVLSLHSAAHDHTRVDLFAEAPFDFAATAAVAMEVDLGGGLRAPVVPLATLLKMKELAGRPQDLEDVRRLRELHGESGDR
jgi:hypothetical protein